MAFLDNIDNNYQGGVWHDADWSQRVLLTAQNVTGSHSSFPAYKGGAGFDAAFWNAVKSDGGDLRAVNVSTGNRLAVEVVSIDTGAQTLELHFNTEQISQGEQFYLYCGNAGASMPAAGSTYGSEAVWGGYALVMHLASATHDSTGKNNATDNGTSSTTGEIGNAREFAQNTDNIEVEDEAVINISSAITIQAWVSLNVNDEIHTIVDKGVHENSEGYALYPFDDGMQTIFRLEGVGNPIFSYFPTLDTWEMLHATWDGSTMILYGDADSKGSSSQSGTIRSASGTDLLIGSAVNRDYPFMGKMDELRLRPSALSPNWITTEYNNQDDEPSFWSVSSTETYNPVSAPTVTTSAVSSIDSDSAVGNGEVTDNGGGTVTERGVVYSTSQTPTTADSKAQAVSGGTGTFAAAMQALSPNTTYYVRAYAINSAGTSYGSEVSFTTAAAVTTEADAVAFSYQATVTIPQVKQNGAFAPYAVKVKQNGTFQPATMKVKQGGSF